VLDRRSTSKGIIGALLSAGGATKGALIKPGYKDCDALLWSVATVTRPPLSGIMPQNEDAFGEIGIQRGNARFVGGAIGANKPDLIKLGFSALEATFHHRDNVNGFPYLLAKKAKPEERMLSRLQSTAFFQVELMQAAHIADNLPWGAPYRDKLRHYVDIMRPEAEKIIEEIDEIMIDNLRAANRITLLLRFSFLAEYFYKIKIQRNRYIKAVTSLQLKDGSFLEMGGKDVSYQAAGLTFAGMALLVSMDESLLLYFKNGIKWIDKNVSPDGDIIFNNGSRTSGQESDAKGNVKNPNWMEMTSSFVLGYAFTGNENLLNKAKAIWKKHK